MDLICVDIFGCHAFALNYNFIIVPNYRPLLILWHLGYTSFTNLASFCFTHIYDTLVTPMKSFSFFYFALCTGKSFHAFTWIFDLEVVLGTQIVKRWLVHWDFNKHFSMKKNAVCLFLNFSTSGFWDIYASTHQNRKKNHK